MDDALLRVESLRKYYPVHRGLLGKGAPVRALDGVSFSVRPGEVFGIVGESGCGKSTLGLTVARLLEPDGGRLWFRDTEYTEAAPAQMHQLRKSIQMVFQDPYASLNPRMTVRDILAEPLEIFHLTHTRAETDARVTELLRQVGLDDYHAARYPHEFSGGQRQRIGIARALAVNPALIIADEPVSALDVSVQSQVLNLMSDLRERLCLTYLFIAHDLSVVEYLSDRVGVMYLGNFVEIADKRALYEHPAHPYTRALMSAVPVPDPTVKRERTILPGDIPSPAEMPAGCRFHPRCPACMEICRHTAPQGTEVEPGHWVACHLCEKKA